MAAQKLPTQLATACCLLLSFACGDSNTTSDQAQATGFSLRADSAQYSRSIAGRSPQEGRRFLEVDLTMVNRDEAVPIPMSLALFSVTTRSGLSVRASATSALAKTPCPQDISVAKGGQLSCRLVFEVPRTEEPISLIYDDGTGRNATAPLSIAPETRPCETLEPAWSSSDEKCRQCLGTSCWRELGTSGAEACRSQYECLLEKYRSGTCNPFCSCIDSCVTTPECQAKIEPYLFCLEASCNETCGL
ncbi:MAG: DUF4352 domain-containing protein [Deltaproteobacteria bacterium]|nr:DUF4352 domain-containing protein [Deltaproteobacteria bacterium]